MKLFKTKNEILLQNDIAYYLLKGSLDELINRNNLHNYLLSVSGQSVKIPNDKALEILRNDLLPPIGTQEVWAAGVTYSRSRDARMEESKETGGATFYDKVYEAERPELFFKALPRRVAGHGQEVYIRKDSSWNVPEPELTLYINANGQIQAYTIGNDMSSRSIEGENPLYLPQAKVYEKSAALGPCLYVPGQPISTNTNINIAINRNDKEVFQGSVQLNRMKRLLPELTEYLYRECVFPPGCFLMTGTGIVPPDDFTLQEKDVISISIDEIGILTNTVAVK